MLSRITWTMSVIVLLLVLQAPARVEATFLDDQRIANDVAASLSGDPRFAGIRITTQNGVVYLTGAVDSGATGVRAAQAAQNVVGVRQVVNQLQLASSAPPTVVSTTTPTVVTVITPPAAAAGAPSGTAVMAGHPPVDVQGTVAAYDAQTRIVTLQDGRMVRVQPGQVWQSVSTDAIQPGHQIYARNGEPVGIQAGAPQPGSWRIGTVDRVDLVNGRLHFRDGGIVAVNASTPVTMNGQQVALSQIRPGTQIAVRMDPVATGGSALPRSVVAPVSSAEVVVFQ